MSTSTSTTDILCKIAESECSICLSNLTHTDFTSTKCGHWFHSSCLLQNMVQRVDCPLCRFPLAEIPEDSDSDEDDDDEEDEDEEDSDDDASEINPYEDDTDEEGDNTSNENSATSAFTPIDHTLTCKQVSQKLLSLGYNAEDLIYILVGRLNQGERTKYNREFRNRFENDIDRILTRELPVDYRDTRTYAQVVATE